MSVLTVPRIRASEALTGVSSLDLADQMGSHDLVGPFERRLPVIDNPIFWVATPYVFVLGFLFWGA